MNKIYLYRGSVITASVKDEIATPSSKVKKWYVANFHGTSEGNRMKDISFSNLWKEMKKKKDVYSLLGISDPEILERVFKGVEQAMNLKEGTAYDMWNKNFTKNKEYSKLSKKLNLIKKGL